MSGPTTLTLTATQFKATCLALFDRLAQHGLEKIIVTKRGKVVATLSPPPLEPTVFDEAYGCLAGTVTIPDGLDLTEPVLDEPFSTMEVTDLL